MADTLHVEVVYAGSDRQILRKVEIARGATVMDAIQAADIERDLSDGMLDPARIGIFGRLVSPQTVLCEGDRVELYRALKVDPKESRRRRARRPG